MRAALVAALAAALVGVAAAADPPLFPTNWTSNVYMDGIIGGAAHLLSDARVASSCDAGSPTTQMLRLDERAANPLGGFRAQVTRCDLGAQYEISAADCRLRSKWIITG